MLLRIILPIVLLISLTEELWADWETAVYHDDSWCYLAGDVQPPPNWNALSFDDSGWSIGIGGIGYGDGDDGTLIGIAVSVYSRISFTVDDPGEIAGGVFHADYDDGFIAYLNGVEIFRSASMSELGDSVAHDVLLPHSHEAVVYQWLQPSMMSLSVEVVQELLVSGENVLAIQVHNAENDLDDLTGNFSLSFELNPGFSQFGPVPEWFFAPFPPSPTQLPLIVINTDGQEIPDTWRITGEMGIIRNPQGEFNHPDDPYNHYSGVVGIETRGSSSQMFPKKQYAFETRDIFGESVNVELLGLPAENDWILQGPYSDKSLIRNALTFQLAREMGFYAPRTRFCELVLNSDYRGLYLLVEKIKRDNNRVDVTPMSPGDTDGDALTGGYIIKIDKDEGEQNLGWVSEPDFPGAGSITYLYHYPKPDQLIPIQADYIHDHMDQLENLMESQQFADPDIGYRQWLDLGSLTHLFIINELSINVDGFRFSTFMHKDRDSVDGRLHFGPVWDYNIALGNADYYSGDETDHWHVEYDYPPWDGGVPFWFSRIWSDPAFRLVFERTWFVHRKGVLSDENLSNTIRQLAEDIGAAQERNFQRWDILSEYVWPNPYIGGSYENEVTYLEEWLLERAHWMDQYTELDTMDVLHPDLVINEFMADNDTTITDGFDEYADWLEIYNRSDSPVDVGGMYLTDDLTEPGKYRLPLSDPLATTIAPSGHLLLWADGDPEEGVTHLDFRLAAGGEQIGLFGIDSVTLIDSVSFAQQSSDVSMGRVVDGASEWSVQLSPTPGSANNSEGIRFRELSQPEAVSLRVYPNPCNPTTRISIKLNRSQRLSINVYNLTGALVDEVFFGVLPPGDHSWSYDGSELSSGVYFCVLQSDDGRLVKKMTLLK